MKSLWTAMALTALTVLSASYVLAAELKLTVTEAWTTPSLAPNGGNGAAYLTLHNEGDTPLTLTGARTPVANKTEIHTIRTTKDGVMEMRPVLQAEIPAHGKLKLKPGGMHVMLLGLREGLALGDAFPLTLTFKNDQTLTTQVVVKPLAAKLNEDSGHEHHH